MMEELFIERPAHRFRFSVFDVLGDGNCGYYTFMVVFVWFVLVGMSASLYQTYFPEIGSTDQDVANNSNFAFAICMRQSLLRCLQVNHVELTTRGDWALFLNEKNRPVRVISDSIPIDGPDGNASIPNYVRIKTAMDEYVPNIPINWRVYLILFISKTRLWIMSLPSITVILSHGHS